MKHLLTCVVLSVASATQATANTAGLAEKMIGHVYTAVASNKPFPGFPDCFDEGGSVIYADKKATDFGESVIRCGKVRVLILDVRIGGSDRQPSNRIVDAIVLPPFSRRATWRDGRSVQLWENGFCTLDGDIDPSIRVLLRWGRHHRVTSKTGVMAAWGFDIERGRIVSIDPSRVECDRPDAD